MAGLFKPKPKKQEQTAREKTLKERRARGRALVIFYISAFTAVVIGAVLLCIFVFFKVGEVRLTGGASYREEDILRVCGINEGDNLVLLTTKEREAELEYRFPYIERAKIKKHIPSTIEVEITEAVPYFSVHSDAGYLYVSRAGKILEMAQEPYPGSAVVLGCTPEGAAVSTQIRFAEEAAGEVFGELGRQLEANDVSGITSIDMSNQYDITMTYDERIVFNFGNTNSMKEKMEFGLKMLSQMLSDGGITAETRGEMDLTLVPDKNKAFFRETIESSSEDAGGASAGRDLPVSAGEPDDTGDGDGWDE